ncbi:MAG TPA: hypothetical protein VEJ67_09730 [Candidatus Cybelea sp.]|nr:hypothetical protein [Candidatus Cybelea sp.]
MLSRSSTVRNSWLGLLASLAVWASVSPAQNNARGKIDPQVFEGLRWRSIGPAVFGGRVTDVAGVAGNPNIIYVAHSSAGLFKSTNGGITFDSVFNDGNTLSIGAIALAPDNPEVVYVGTGEGTARNSASFGDGIYKSTDGGRTWKHLGLDNTERFARMVVNPERPDVVFAAAMGHEWGPNRDRGLYRSTDGGATWKQVLYVNETTGAGDVALDPTNPNILYAGMYDYLRQPWYFRSGGPGSGLYRSVDGGDTWRKLTDPGIPNGLPSGQPLGRIEVRISPSNPAVVYAMIESRQGLLWRSDDYGEHWAMVNKDNRINPRPFYFSNIRVDPRDENRIYVLASDPWISEDGGKTFHSVDYWTVFGDCHALWIDPSNPSRLMLGSDGGLFISNDRGKDWEFSNNMPMAQAYHVAVDMADPYNVLGGFQDHEMWRGPNERWDVTGVRGGDWRRLRAHADGMFIVADPRDPNVIYYDGQGDITRFDMRTHEERYIQPYPVATAGVGAGMMKYRFNWNPPILMSEFNPDVIYHAANVVFKTTDGGYSWSVISPDLTTNHPEELKLSGGPVSPDNSTAESHCTITALAESALDAQTLWAGTDDGNLEVTHDGGQHWTNVAPNLSGLAQEAWVTSISTSRRDKATVYASFDRHQLDDFAPYIYVTHDSGRTWSRIVGGLRGYVHVVAEDPKQANLLYAGTELGFFVSFDAGQNWADFRLGLPPLPVYDLRVHPRENDLIIATHARGFYILDDATPLQQLAQAMDSSVALFPPSRGTRYNRWSDTSTLGSRVWVGQNKPYGSIISYYLAAAVPGGRVRITILDPSGKAIRTMEGPGARGVNRAVWDLRETAPVETPPGAEGMFGRVEGIRVLPGEYTARLQALGEMKEQKFQVRMDPNVKASAEDMAEYAKAMMRLNRMQVEIAQSLERMRRIDAQLAAGESAWHDSDAVKLGSEIQQELAEVRSDLVPPRYSPEHLNLTIRVNELAEEVGNYSGRPTEAQEEYIGVFDGQLQGVLKRLEGVLSGDLERLNDRLAAAHVPNISPESQLARKP